jgi:2'-hydroxyisoflavone reductase
MIEGVPIHEDCFMKLLIIGGTVFLGRYQVESALVRGHEVTLFNRGKSNADLFPEVEKLRGDRALDLSPLKGHQWDAVIDTCGYIPRHVREMTELLKDSVGHYTFISSISVYGDTSQRGIDESYPVATLKEPTEEVTGETYGALKALCEQAAEEVMPGRVLSLRAGLIVGPYDYTGRFPYWVNRIAEGGEVLAPGKPEQPVQVIDVRDLAEWNIRMSENHQVGIYNATGPDYLLTMGQMLETCKTVSCSDATFTWVNQKFLAQEAVSPWQDMPLWLPEGEEFDSFMRINCAKAMNDGLSFQPLEATVSTTLEWINNANDQSKLGERSLDIRAGISRSREIDLLERWRQQFEAQ